MLIHAARCPVLMCPDRSLIASTEENSAVAQSLIARCCGPRSPNQRSLRSVSASWVKAATSTEVSR